MQARIPATQDRASFAGPTTVGPTGPWRKIDLKTDFQDADMTEHPSNPFADTPIVDQAGIPRTEPAMMRFGDGGWVVTRDCFGQNGPGGGIHVRRCDATGTARGGELRAGIYTVGARLRSAVSARAPSAADGRVPRQGHSTALASTGPVPAGDGKRPARSVFYVSE